jgi:hypothetical protein
MVLIDRRELEQLKQKQEDSAVHRSQRTKSPRIR